MPIDVTDQFVIPGSTRRALPTLDISVTKVFPDKHRNSKRHSACLTACEDKNYRRKRKISQPPPCRLGVKTKTSDAKATTKDLASKAKAKDLLPKAKDWDSRAKAKAEDFTVNVKAKTKDSFASFTLGHKNA